MGLRDRFQERVQQAAARPDGGAQAAQAAWDQHARIFQAELPVNAEASRTLEQIEDIGWTLNHVSHVHVTTGLRNNLRDPGITGPAQKMTGHITGIYLFRRP